MTEPGPKTQAGVMPAQNVRDFATFERALRAATAAQAQRVGRRLTKREVAALANELLARSGNVWELNVFENLL